MFASPGFDANEYANAVLVGEQYPAKPGTMRVPATISSQIMKEDVSAAISRLDSGIESVSKQLKGVVSDAVTIGLLITSCNRLPHTTRSCSFKRLVSTISRALYTECVWGWMS